jgi:hypothetical protein
MKNYLNFAFSLVFLSFSNTELKASHIVGGEINYTPRSVKSVYMVYFTLYRECSGTPLQTVDFKVSCMDGSNSVTLNPTRTSIVDISTVCSKDSLPCNPQNTTTAAGLEKHTYEILIDFNKYPYLALKNNCCKVLFTMSACCRNGSITTLSPGNFYLDAMVDLCMNDMLGNNSVQFTNTPPKEICCYMPFTYSPGITDAIDRDSLSIELVTPLKDFNDPEVYTGGFSGSIPMTPYCPPNPGKLDCYALPGAKPPRGLYFEASTGSIVFTPTNCNEVGVFVIKISEWRKKDVGVMELIGYVKREFVLFVRTCPDNNPPYFAGNNKYSVCEGDKLCFTISTKDEPYLPKQTTLDTVSMQWDSAISGATFRIIDPSAREKQAEFCWQTKIGDASANPQFFTVSAKDDNCPYVQMSNRTYMVTVKPRATTILSSWYKLKGNLVYSSWPDLVPPATYDQFRYEFILRDSTNSGTPIFRTFNRIDSFTFTRPGRYYLEHWINNPPYNCPKVYYDTIIVTPEFLTSVYSREIISLNVYPNPAKDLISFNTTDDLNGAIMSLYSVDGKLVYERLLHGNETKLHDLASGVYSLVIVNDRKVYKAQLIIQ